MSVYQDKKSKKWYFEAMIRGKRYHRAIPEAVTKRDADNYFNAFKTDLLRGKLDLVENIGCKPFKELVKVYVEYSTTNHRSYKTNVAKAYKFEKLWGNRQLKDISPMDIEKYKIARKNEVKSKAKIIDGVKIPEKNISATTINRDIEVLRKMFNIAIDNGWLTKNPCKSVKKLRDNLRRNNIPESQVEIFQCALGNKTAAIKFDADGIRCDIPGECETVIRKLDDLLQERHVPVGLIKADVEGMGVELLQGAIKTIERYRPVLALSCYHTPTELFGQFELLKTRCPFYSISFVSLPPGRGWELTMLAVPEVLHDNA